MLLNKYTKEKQEKIRKRFDKIFTEIINEVLTDSYDAEEIKEIFRIGSEVYKYKKNLLRKDGNNDSNI